ncbi:SAM-dependent methyltransferase [Nonomuraea longicatena]|uniref:S-adenosyl methyltransferase n=1 Tax=Nonomuraea longicatena TaxID=83682 RepID=A0ABP4BR71_9ACTN
MTKLSTVQPPHQSASTSDTAIAFDTALDPTRPNTSRLYNYLVLGKDHRAPDRDLAESLRFWLPGLAYAVQACRSFALEAVAAAAGSGCGLILDLRCGYPLGETVHAAALKANPDAQVLYVDDDPVVAVHARALLADGPAVQMMQADIRHNLGRVLVHPCVRARIDLREPVAVVMTGLAEFLTDDELTAVLDTLADTLPPGSRLALSHVDPGVIPKQAIETATTECANAGILLRFRPAWKVRDLLGSRWNWDELPSDSLHHLFLDEPTTFIGGVATLFPSEENR